MRTRWMIGVSALIAVLVVHASAQGRPDFSGTWVPVDDAGMAPPLPPSTPGGPPPPPPPPRTRSMTITQSAAELTLDRQLETAGRESVATFIYKPDGPPTVNRMGALVFTTRAAWEGDALVLSSAVSTEGQAVGELSERYRLVDGNLVVETARKTPAGTFTGRTVHARKP
jgi:hypothetical protein